MGAHRWLLSLVKLSYYKVCLVRLFVLARGNCTNAFYLRQRTRELHKCILSKASWNTVKVTQEAKGEIQFWRENSRLLNDEGKQANEEAVYNVRMYCGACSTGYGGSLGPAFVRTYM